MNQNTTTAVTILPDGTIAFVWDDALAFTVGLGAVRMPRASNVEWPAGADGWIADMSPVNGPALGPFLERADALRAEREWLDAHPQALAVAAGSAA